VRHGSWAQVLTSSSQIGKTSTSGNPSIGNSQFEIVPIPHSGTLWVFRIFAVIRHSALRIPHSDRTLVHSYGFVFDVHSAYGISHSAFRSYPRPFVRSCVYSLKSHVHIGHNVPELRVMEGGHCDAGKLP